MPAVRQRVAGMGRLAGLQSAQPMMTIMPVVVGAGELVIALP